MENQAQRVSGDKHHTSEVFLETVHREGNKGTYFYFVFLGHLVAVKYINHFIWLSSLLIFKAEACWENLHLLQQLEDLLTHLSFRILTSHI